MKFDVCDFLTGLLNNGVKFYIPRPIAEFIDSGDVDIIVYEEYIDRFESYLEGKYKKFSCLNSRYAFKTSEYIIGNISIDVKKAVCFGERKQITCIEKPLTESIEVIDGYIYPGSKDDKQLFQVIWLLHLILDKREPEDSSTYFLFEKFLNDVNLNLDLINTLSFVVCRGAQYSDPLDFNKLRSDLLSDLKLENKVLSLSVPMFFFRCYFYLRRRFIYGKK